MDEALQRAKMQKVCDAVVSDLSSIRTGRATPALLQDLPVMVYGGTQRLKIQELASLSLQDSQTIIVDPWDKSIIGEIAKGILSANVGLNPQISSSGGGMDQTGEIIRIILPPLTSEDREKYVKLLSQKLESGKVMIRQVRGETMKELEKAFSAKEFGEDEKYTKEKLIQKITDEFIEKIDNLGEIKKRELLQV